MKSIGIITDRDSYLTKFLEDNLRQVLGDKIVINSYFLDHLEEKDIIEDKVVLVMIRERAYEIKKYVSAKSKIIVVNRTFREDEIYKVFSIPEGTEVLVVNDNDQTTYETVSLFYEVGVTHLNLIAYKENVDYSNVNIALTPGVSERIPSHIKKIIDLGNRYIDISTFMQVISALEIDTIDIGKKLIKYSEKIVSLDGGIRDKYKELFLKMDELDTIVNISRDGVIFTNDKGIIKVFNESFRNILDLEGNIQGVSVEEIFKKGLERILKKEEILDEVFQFKDKYINVKKTSIYNLGVKAGSYYNIQEITYIKQLEQNLTKQIKARGQIARYYFNNIKTNSPSMIQCINLAKKISKSDLTVFIRGESGTGKELLAQSIHNESERKKQAFVAVNCAAMPENLLESELFGYEKGAFTGALKEGKKGLFEAANNGTIFLDEIGDMPVLLQTKLLRVLQERQIMPIGSENIININVRIIAATNKDILKMIKEDKFRKDLYYRLNVLPIMVPPLRERTGDIIDLLNYFIGRKIYIEDEVKDILIGYGWPGNIRELQNVASYISLMCDDKVEVKNLPSTLDYKEKNCNYEKEILKSSCDFEKAIEFLNLINSFNKLEKNIGRVAIINILKERGLEISEGEAKKILETLKDLELINSYVGRKGSKITKKGYNFLIKNK
ncbi:sigma-54 interaction domain-containing protein [Clostridium algidicarnis]|uniref:Sigma 54-interacting transcriptional regulator n=1 Tax=Clostridium algidicarnis TaxID=37659 RepID=A0ABS6C461_9CLOT|nr:sigma 54-interacting transcriptional regulator [Clostridium algidicarnis]MBU3194035.1 sigma 54-interacting transcriptional regulator [Clostridium algidicarnis]MBU3202894.1 sigma 54-interacting transcriptional regulator [Clostridium algidicarnis]MBU3205804.1 sigma 54-interacting transcriptional regulator [Clostridium algidicarnis]MBU3211048.1 sigma 54-interacting transcriptional regulator [Clostridium algidicarnis]MBU3220236.1 sigma 54-interacting transcriptional regulator [Clostridium algid